MQDYKKFFCNLLIVLFGHNICFIAGQCDSSWAPIGNYCYRASQLISETDNSWEDARSYCLSEGGDLVSILADNEKDFVQILMDQSTVATKFHIGLNTLLDSDNWSDGSQINYTFWANNQPDNEDETNMCVYADAEDDGSWYMENCGVDVNIGSVCKKLIGSDQPITIEPTDTVQSFCPQGYFDVNGGNKCYRLFLHNASVDEGIALNFDDARDFCRSQPGINPDLASINSIQEQAAITARLNGVSWGLWIGYYYDADSGIWHWTDQSTARFENWAPFEPTNVDNFCIEMYVLSTYTGQWASIFCGDSRGYICQTYKDAESPILTPPLTSPHSCSTGWTPYYNGCYQFYNTYTTWQAAENICVSEGGHLASVVNPEENAAIFYLASNSSATGNIWIGLSEDPSDQQYKWSDGLPVIYTNYEGGSPGSGQCISMNDEQSWVGGDCITTAYRFVCKQTTGAMPTTPVYVPGTCPGEDWQEWGQYCYLFSAFNSVVYEVAEQACQQEGGHLVSIHSHMENRYVRDGMLAAGVYDNAWIGLYKEPGTDLDAFQWKDGSPVDYTHWAMGEPNNPISEHCTEIYADDDTVLFALLWNNNECGLFRDFACKYDKGAPPPSGNSSIAQPQYYLTHNTTFSSSTGADFTPQCTQAYSTQMNSKAQLLVDDVNSRIGIQICLGMGITTEQIRVAFTTCPFSTSGNTGVTDPVYLLTTNAELTLSNVHDCMAEISDYMALHSSWGDPVLDPEPGCPGVNFPGSMFNEAGNRYLCLGARKTNVRRAIDVAFLNYGVFHVGVFHSEDGSVITNQCITRYTATFTARALGMASQVNDAIANGDICNGQAVTVTSISPLFLTASDDQGSTSLRYIIEPSQELTFNEISACASQISAYLADHDNWGYPILDPIEGCPTLIFDPAMFQETEQEWICNNGNTDAKKDSPEEIEKESKDPEKYPIITRNDEHPAKSAVNKHKVHSRKYMQNTLRKLLLGHK